MNRPLTDQEKEQTKKGMERNMEEVKKLKDSLEYNKAILTIQQTQRDFDDKWLPYKRQLKDESDNHSIKELEGEIKMKEETINILENHLKKGVEKK